MDAVVKMDIGEQGYYFQDAVWKSRPDASLTYFAVQNNVNNRELQKSWMNHLHKCYKKSPYQKSMDLFYRSIARALVVVRIEHIFSGAAVRAIPVIR